MKQKFKFGQVVFVDEEGVYGDINGIRTSNYTKEPEDEYQVHYNHDFRWWPASALRALTKREEGR
jgi:hypothetical protein